MLDFFAGIIAIMFVTTIIAIMLGLLVLVLVIRIIGAIVSAARNKGNDYSDYSATTSTTSTTYDSWSKSYNYNNTQSESSAPDIDDVETEDNEEKTLLEKEEEERLGEPYICPECFEPYDGIYCDACGHSNDEIGYEEVSEDEKWVEHMTSIAMFDAEDKRLKADRFLDDGFHEDFD